jgi:hypothetical protein
MSFFRGFRARGDAAANDTPALSGRKKTKNNACQVLTYSPKPFHLDFPGQTDVFSSMAPVFFKNPF